MSLSLPNFDVLLIQKDPNQNTDNTFIQTSIKLDDYVKQNNQGLVLYFYPKDNTQGCTIQAQDFSADIAAYQQKGYRVIGVSRDSVKSHQNFINKHNLNIGLISDSDEKLCQYFDVIKEKTLYGKKHLGVVRSTFVFDNQGILIHELRNIKAKEHSSKLLAML